jgi:hypothetical protein
MLAFECLNQVSLSCCGWIVLTYQQFFSLHFLHNWNAAAEREVELWLVMKAQQRKIATAALSGP